MYVVGYGCYTAAGRGAHALYQGLLAGRDYCTRLDATGWPVVPMTGARLCRWQEPPPGATQKEQLAQALLACLDEIRTVQPRAEEALRSPKLGVIFASTKGCIEDHVWEANFAEQSEDTLTPVLKEFLDVSGLSPRLSLCVSNACSSVHGALWLAKEWMKQQRAEHVLVVAADQVGPFVVNGFSALKTFAESRVTPFAKERQGIQLGDAAVALLLSASIESFAVISGIEIESDGFAATRSDQSGAALKHVVTKLPKPDLVIAHATGTPANDVVEDHVYGAVYGRSVPVTCTKWSVGHGLGASGGIDVIAGLEVLRHQKTFAIGNTAEADPAFSARYLVQGSSVDQGPLRRIMTSTMGFGGMHGALMLELAEPASAQNSLLGCTPSLAAVPAPEIYSFTCLIDPDVKEEPSWAARVPRWHQLDPLTFAVVEAGARLRLQDHDVWRHKPAEIWIAATEGSNVADHDFVHTGSRSPSRFVGTLPSIRSSSLALLMDWHGPVLCLVAGVETEARTREEILYHRKSSGATGPVWMVSCRTQGRGSSRRYEVTFDCFK